MAEFFKDFLCQPLRSFFYFHFFMGETCVSAYLHILLVLFV